MVAAIAAMTVVQWATNLAMGVDRKEAGRQQVLLLESCECWKA